MKHLLKKVNVEYLGSDIVEEIINLNIQKYKSDKINFKKINIINDKLPNADLMICRDCLFHFSYDDIFSEQLKNFVEEGDILIAISCSGNSINVIKAVEESKRRGIKTIGLTGNAGKLEQLSDLVIKVPSDNILLIEGVHSVLLHYITEILRG